MTEADGLYSLEKILTLSGFILTVISIILTIYFWRKSRRGIIVYLLSTVHVIGRSEYTIGDGIEVLFRGRSVENIYSTMIVIWNDGSFPIRSSDTTGRDPLRIGGFLPVTILQSTLIKSSRLENCVSIQSHDDTSIQVDFDFLDANDGAIIEIIHSERGFPMCLGTIIGSQASPKKLGPLSSEQRSNIDQPENKKSTLRSISQRFERIFPYAILIASVYLTFAFTFNPQYSESNGFSFELTIRPIAFFSFVIAVLCIVSIISNLRIPKNLLR